MLRIFYIEYFSAFAGDFAPIVVRNAGLFAVWVGEWIIDRWQMINDQTRRRCFVALFHRTVLSC